MREQILAVSICLSLALTPAVSAASPNAGEALTEETRTENVRNGETRSGEALTEDARSSEALTEETSSGEARNVEAPAEEVAPASEPMAAQADSQAPATEETLGAAEEPALPGVPDGEGVVEANSIAIKETGEQPLADLDGVLAPQAVYTGPLYDGSYTPECQLYPGGGGAEYTFTLSHRSRVDIRYEVKLGAGGGAYHIQMYDNRGGKWRQRKMQHGNGYTSYTYNISYGDTSSPMSIGPGQFRVVVWYSNPYYSSPCTTKVKLNIKPLFNDLPKSHWAANVVADSVDRGYMNGYSDAKFGTNDNITRAQVATILWNMQGNPKPRSKSSFWDVSENAYYASAVAWAKSAGVVSGYNNGSFKPAQNVSRQELAVMLYNYAVRCRKASRSGEGWWSFSYMYDASSVSGYARNGVGWCFYRDIMNGSNGYIRPTASATRAEAAKMFLYTGKLLRL